MTEYGIEEIVSLAKRRGFVFPGSEIYGGLANSWDYGPLGVELKRNIKELWWNSFITKRRDVVGLDSAILMNPKTWEASGHLGGFSDPLMDCRNCKTRHRADKLLENAMSGKNQGESVEGLSNKELEEKIKALGVKCPHCGVADFTEIRQFNLMFKTFQGVTEESSAVVYLRPETAQGIFVNFRNAQTTSRKKLPFGIGQIGKSFRNEITPGNFIFRTREFEQMELEYFCRPDESLEKFEFWQDFCFNWLLEIGIKPELLKKRKHSQQELSHYSQATTDIEFSFPFGWGELWGIAHRGDYDLTQHQNHSKKDLTYFDTNANEKILPHVIEPSLGVDRLLLAILCSAYESDCVDGETRTVLKLHHAIAPVKVAVLPLSKKLKEQAEKIADDLATDFPLEFDETGSIGKRYRRQDEIGTPFCITVDFETPEDKSVTIRHRDTTAQERVPLDALKETIFKNLN